MEMKPKYRATKKVPDSWSEEVGGAKEIQKPGLPKAGGRPAEHSVCPGSRVTKMCQRSGTDQLCEFW